MKVPCKNLSTSQKKASFEDIINKKNVPSTKISLKNSILNLKAQQPTFIKIWSSQQISTLYSAKLYLMWLKKVINILGEDPVKDAVDKKEAMESSHVEEPEKKVRFSSVVNTCISLASCSEKENFLKVLKKELPVERLTKEPLAEDLKKEPPVGVLKLGVDDKLSTCKKVNLCDKLNLQHSKKERGCLVKEILRDDPLWCSGSMSVFPWGQSPKDKYMSHLCAEFSPSEPPAGILSPNEFKEIIKAQQKSFPAEERRSRNSFQSPLFANSQDEKGGLKGVTNEPISPWKKTFNVADQNSFVPFLV